MQPYRLMPYRASSYSPDAFSYYDHTYGEARKELHFSMTGRDYKQVLTIDNERRKQECYLYAADNGKWRALNPDGGTRTYDRAIDAVMGMPKMFFTSIFRCQDAVTISEASKKDMWEIFAELLNSDGVLALGKKAADVVSKLIGHLEGLRREAVPLEKIVSRKEATEKERQTTLDALIGIAREIDALEKETQKKAGTLAAIDTELALENEKVKTRERLLAVAERKRTRYAEIEEAVSTRKTEYETKAAALKKKNPCAERRHRGGIRTVRRRRRRGNPRGNGQEPYRKHCLVRHQVREGQYKKLAGQAEHDRLLNKSEMELQRVRANKAHAITTVETSLRNMKEKAAMLTSTPCSAAEGTTFSSTCIFLEDARAALQAIPGKEEELAAFKTSEDPEEERLTGEVTGLKKKCEERPAIETEAKGILSLKENLEIKKREAEEKLQAIRKHVKALIEKGLAEKELPERLAEQVAHAAERGEYLAGSEEEKTRISKEIDALVREASTIVIDEALPEKRKELAEQLSRIGPSIEKKRRTEGEHKVRSGVLEESSRQIASAETRLVVLAKEMEFYNNEIPSGRCSRKHWGRMGSSPSKSRTRVRGRAERQRTASGLRLPLHRAVKYPGSGQRRKSRKMSSI